MTVARSKLASLPGRPGVYVFRNPEGEVIYVGKAKSLKDRVRSYFQAPAPGDYKGEALHDEIADLEVNVCETEVDALILEATLIKKYLPRYNVILRDDKSYPYIAVTVSDEFPTVSLSRGRRVRGTRYYGPYVNARAARNTIRLLQKVFPLRHCAGREPGQKGRSPCLYYDMHMCLGPCRGVVEPEEYMGHVKQFCDFLEGRYSEVLGDLDTRMRAAARDQEYEEAARIRNQIESANWVLRHHRALSSSTEDYDVVGIESDSVRACFAVGRNRGGFHLGNLVFFSDLPEEKDAGELAAEFLKRYYAGATSVPTLVLVPALSGEERESLEAWLSKLRGTRVEIRVPARGRKKNEMALASANARLALEGAKLELARDKSRLDEAIAGLASGLGLQNYPIRIECYDVSTMMGSASVASMVVFQDGNPARRDYRRFRVKFTPGMDDVGMTREVLYRRFKRYCKELESGVSYQRSSWAKKPDLVLLDGGKGQLGAAREVLGILGITGVDIAALAKRLEEVYLPDRPEPVVLPRASEPLFLLQRIRDEAHRAAVTYHRSVMERSTSSSWLDDVAGVGPGRKKTLLRHFGSPRKVEEATLEELEEVSGLPDTVALGVFQAARRRKGGRDEG
ncbi:MAG: excinuclease ABC subunit UvrC [Actinobacteria bacterium]|nr:excinuclease ABC subunit UvrC [Actinomycetota bacterium]MBU1944695.1 excinuclease ABC subunit UvrC [Actinomycetota bacterium]MBU2689243.1 excinuclease ABC subunit UvrC [Actinomycetota bacterium]